jgi:hypothetical protein
LSRRARRGLPLPVAALTLAAAAAVLLDSALAAPALRLWLVGVGALVCWAVVGTALDAWAASESPSFALSLPWRRPAAPERLRPLEELERAVEFSLTTAFDVHFRLRPHLVRIAANRLAERGVSLLAEPARARAMLGPDVWELVRPDLDPPTERSARGLDLAR